MNLGYVERESSMHWPTMNAGMNEITTICRAALVKKHGVGFEKANIIEP